MPNSASLLVPAGATTRLISATLPDESGCKPPSSHISVEDAAKLITGAASQPSCPPGFGLGGKPINGGCPRSLSPPSAPVPLPGATYTRMNGLGHFPMSEVPESSKKYLRQLLDTIMSK